MPWPEDKKRVCDVCRHFPLGAPPDHYRDCNAPILVIGEAPGQRENARGLPFVGPAGRLLTDLLKEVGLKREDCYITNVLPWQPPSGNDFTSVPPNYLQKAIHIVKIKIQNSKFKVIVPLGNEALFAAHDHKGIMKWRGSVRLIDDKWSVASIHPAAMLRSPALKKTAIYDWRRINAISVNGWTPLDYELVCTSWNDRRLERLRTSKVLAADIETVRGTSKVLCVSFCGDGRTSYSVDCRKGIPPIVRDLLESDIPKIFQNGLFDCYILACNDIEVRNFVYDTCLMFHALDNNAGPVTSASSERGSSTIKPYSLAYMASVFSPLPYWKDSGKDDNTGEAAAGYRSNWQRFSEYNALDSLGTYIIAKELKKRLKDENRLDFYRSQYAALIYPILDLSMRGVRFDVDGAREAAERLRVDCVRLRDQIETLAGRPLRQFKIFKKEPKVKEDRKDGLLISCNQDGKWIGEKKSISNAVLQKYLYGSLSEGGLGLKRQTKDGHTTSDEIAIRNLLLFAKEHYRGDKKRVTAFLETLLRFRDIEKTIQFLAAGASDHDGRIRASYGLNVQTGRLRSSGNPTGTGYNLQNIQRNIRHFFLPDTPIELGCDGEATFFVELDLKQAEDLVVKTISSAVTGTTEALQLVQAVRDGSLDIHRRLASVVFGVPPKDIGYEQRYVTKRCRHGINNGMGSKRMQQTLLKDGFVYTTGEVERIFRAINDAEPWVLDFHKAIRRAIMRRGGVSTSWGWNLILDSRFERLSEPRTFNRAYTFIEQSEVGVLLKQYGLLTFWNVIRPRFRARLNMLVHDNVVLSVPRSELYEVTKIIYDAITAPRKYGIRHPSNCDCGSCDAVALVELSIPAEIKINTRLSCTCESCKAGKPPLELDSITDRDAFEAAVNKWLEEN